MQDNIDLDNPRDPETIEQELAELPDYWGTGLFGEPDLLLELSLAYAGQDEDEWGDPEEKYPTVTEGW